MSRSNHLAGIIPVANFESDIEVPYDPCMLPVSNGLTAIQKSVFECALAGCNTIWIVANDDLAPIVRHTVGEWVYDPVYYERTYTKFYKEHRKEVPIYYVPINPKDRNRRDSYGWSILHGINSAWYTAYKISKWIIPDNYYICFPMSAYDIYGVREHRKEISNPNKNFFMSYQGKTVKDDEYLAFTMKGDDFKKCRNLINKTTTREYLPPLPSQRYPSQKIPLHQRWSARNFPNSKILSPLQIDNSTVVDLNWYYNISSWDGYVEYMSSENSIKTPTKDLTLPHRHANIPYST